MPSVIRSLKDRARARRKPLVPTCEGGCDPLSRVVYGTDRAGSYAIPKPDPAGDLTVTLGATVTAAEAEDAAAARAARERVPTDAELAAQMAALLTPSKP